MISKAVRDYMAGIGAKGGAKRKTRPDRAQLASKAALARWHRNKTTPKQNVAKRVSKSKATKPIPADW